MALLDRKEADVIEGQHFVRRFTDELSGDTALERETRAAQERYDNEGETEQLAKWRALYGDEKHISSVTFEGAKTARDTLDEYCGHLKSRLETNYSKTWRFRKSSQLRKDQNLLSAMAVDKIEDLTTTIDNLEEKWKQTHSKAYKSFNKICDSLNAHRALFSIFPSTSIYTSVLSGSLSLIVQEFSQPELTTFRAQTAVNHESIAEIMSESVAQVSGKAALCTDLLKVINTERMKKRLADIYTKVFDLFRETIQWYLKGRTSRFFLSFGEDMAPKYQEVVASIDNDISQMYQEAAIGGYAMQRINQAHAKIMSQGIEDIKAEVLRQRQNPPQRSQDLGFDVGNLMRSTLLANYESITLRLEGGEEYTISKKTSSQGSAHTIKERSTEAPKVGHLSRKEALDLAQSLEEYVVAMDWTALLPDPRKQLLESSVISRLQDWIGTEGQPQLLWLWTSDIQTQSSARAASLSVISAAIQLGVPFVAHLCDKPRTNSTSASRSPENIGLMGLLYSLILQLLQFNVENDDIQLSETDLTRLNGSEASFDGALVVLRNLLRSTPYLPYCIVHGLNVLESPEERQNCDRLLSVLIDHFDSGGTTFNLLLTTSGQSRLLSRIPVKNRYQASHNVREVQRRGQTLQVQKRQ